MIMLSVSENILLFIAGLGVAQAVLLSALLLFYPKSDRSVNQFLAFHILILTVPMIIPILQRVFSWQAVNLIEPVLTLVGPSLYLYVRSFKEVITWKKAWPHFILFVLCLFLAWWVYSAIGSKYPASVHIPVDAASKPLLFLPITIRLVQRLLYYFLSRKELSTYQRSIRHLFSDTSRIDLNWVRWLLNGSLFLLVITAFFYTLMIRLPQYLDWWILMPAAFVSVYIYMATFKGLTQLTLWQMRPGIDKEQLEEELVQAEQMELQKTNEEKTASQKNRLADSKTSEIVVKILAVMEQEKLFQETELTVQDLADKLQFPSYQVSQAINEGMKKNFYDLVNSYRVEEAKRLLLDSRNRSYTILSVGFEAGFNSKTTFNTVFKKFTGLTPTEYREKQKKAVLTA